MEYKSRAHLENEGHISPREHVIHNMVFKHNGDGTVDIINDVPKPLKLDSHAYDLGNVLLSCPDLLKPIGKLNSGALEDMDKIQEQVEFYTEVERQQAQHAEESLI